MKKFDEKIFHQNKFWWKKMKKKIWWKKFFSKKIFFIKNFFQKKFLKKNFFDEKIFWIKKFFWWKNLMKKIWWKNLMKKFFIKIWWKNFSSKLIQMKNFSLYTTFPSTQLQTRITFKRILKVLFLTRFHLVSDPNSFFRNKHA